MAYIGPLPAETFTSFATQEFSTSATTSYTLDHAVTNENEIALFINNVRQQPGSGKAYTATGTALTLSAATASTDTMYAVFLGRALQTVNPADSSVGASQVADNLISGKTALAATPADTDEFLISDAGVLKRIDYSYIKSLGGAISASMDTINGSQTTTSTSYASIGSGLSITVTPASSSSKFLLLYCSAVYGDYIHISFFRGSTNLATDNTSASSIIGYHSGSQWSNMAISFLDAPNTTSQITYEAKFKTSNGSNTAYVGDNNSQLATFTLIEL